jgi:hypothetical protein
MPPAALAASPRHLPPPLAALLAVALALAAAGCGEQRTPLRGAATEPVQAVALLSGHLRANDLQAFARDAVPPSLHPSLAAAWRSGRTRWPLEELPFDHRIPGVLATLSAEGAEARLRRTFDRQFANAHTELRAAARALGLFGAKYVQNDQSLSAEERAHYVQLVEAMADWGDTARLGDPKRARAAIAKLSLAARQSGLRDEADFRRLGMDESLRELGPMAAALKAALAGYGLDLDASLDAMSLSLESRDGDHARVRMRYPLAGRTIDTVVAVERVDGHWYLSDFLRHARAAAAPPPAPVPLPPVAPPETAATTKPTSS